MRNFRATWPAIAITASLAIAAVLVVGVVLAGREVPLAPRALPIVLQHGGAFGHRLTSRGGKAWSFDYDRVQTSPDGSMATIDGVHGGLLYKNGKPYLKISAQHITANTVNNDYTATGQIHIEALGNGIKRSFDTDLAVWQNYNKTLTLAHPSIVRSGDAMLTFKTVTVDFNTGKVHVGPIAGSLKV
ncbi:MAG: hypothetical protein M3160_06735 [Candidatus Eremiobacteraeota bacterium]|nr:hypothetical protein [Candidatus Eremiobacteraeota bacterium]